jgi:hypothetical protein
MGNEAHARIVIDKLLEAVGWDITNLSQVSPDEAASDGRADYILKDTKTRPLAVIEAKRFSIDPYSAKEQAKEYATSLPVPFVILSNGNEHYFWDYLETDARPPPPCCNPCNIDNCKVSEFKCGDMGFLCDSNICNVKNTCQGTSDPYFTCNGTTCNTCGTENNCYFIFNCYGSNVCQTLNRCDTPGPFRCVPTSGNNYVGQNTNW